MSILLHNVQLNGTAVDITIDGSVINSIHPAGTATCGFEAVDCTGLAAYPGLHNMHSHAPMTLFRGLGDDQPLDVWLNDYIWPAERRLTDELVYQGTLQACREMLASGTTFFNDMYFRLFSMAKAVEESGIKARLGYNVFNDAKELDDPEVVDLLTHPSQRVSYSIAPHSVYAVSEDGLRRSAAACHALHLPMHIHMSETQKEVDNCLAQYGCRPWELLDRLGILDLLGDTIIAAHCLHLSDREIRLIGEHHITCVHCPNSNLKLGSGYRFPMLELLEAGARVALGTDGSASSNNLDMVEVMKVSTLLQKGWRGDPTVVPAAQILATATASQTLLAGQPADLFLSEALNVSDLVYTSHGENVRMTLVNGKIVYQK